MTAISCLIRTQFFYQQLVMKAGARFLMQKKMHVISTHVLAPVKGSLLPNKELTTELSGWWGRQAGWLPHHCLIRCVFQKTASSQFYSMSNLMLTLHTELSTMLDTHNITHNITRRTELSVICQTMLEVCHVMPPLFVTVMHSSYSRLDYLQGAETQRLQ